jgi:cholera toxin transcriptional activator
MRGTQPARLYRFGSFEVDAASGELRRQGIRIRLHAQPFQLLLMLLERPGELLSREDIARTLWPEGTFVDYEHGVNSAMNRLREALGDTAANPRFVETLARRGYRWIAPVEKDREQGIEGSGDPGTREAEPGDEGASVKGQDEGGPSPSLGVGPALLERILARPEDLPAAPHHVVKTLFVLFQLMYLAFYVGALANLREIGELLAPLRHAGLAMNVLIVTAAILIPVRAFLVTAMAFRAPRLRGQFLRLWPLLLVLDELWALAPFLLLHHINMGLAIACMALLVYSPFAQRSLVLMQPGIR